jgi:3-dehydroquinate synthase
MPTVFVNIPGAPYDVHVERGLLERVASRVRDLTGAKRLAVVTDANVRPLHLPLVRRSCEAAGVEMIDVTIPAGEGHKTLATVQTIYDQLLDARIDRNTPVAALGGGVVGDVAGFAAATVLRGVPLVQVPTTLLAMVDASVGGKTGVNLREGKNLVGAFHQPRLVAIDVETLTSLPERERAAGFAEVVKKAAIWDAELFEALERDAEALLALEERVLVPVLARAVEIKAEVVSRDEREAGLRMLLNFGHTLAHAIETLGGYRGLLHGEAVAIGMVYAAERSEALGFAPLGTAARLAKLCQRFGLPTQPPAYARSAYLAALQVDKKKPDSRIHYVVLEGMGSARTEPLLPSEVAAALPARPPRKRRGSGARRR